MKRSLYPFCAIVGQDMMKLALLLNVIDPSISGVLIRGERGTGKSTVVRSLVDILPSIRVIDGDPFNLSPDTEMDVYRESRKVLGEGEEEEIHIITRRVKVVELPLGVTEDRVVGSLDMEYALRKGMRRIQPGILADAHRGILYVDEINLLEDHIVDILLDCAAMGVNTIEREGISFSHPSRFVLVGTMNPEEGELRPQLLDRFGLCVNVSSVEEMEKRIEIVERRLAFEADPWSFCKSWEREQNRLRERIEKAIHLYPRVEISRELLVSIISRCLEMEVDGHRADIVMLKAAKALAAYNGREWVEEEDVEKASLLALPHRMRRSPFEEVDITRGK